LLQKNFIKKIINFLSVAFEEGVFSDYAPESDISEIITIFDYLIRNSPGYDRDISTCMPELFKIEEKKIKYLLNISRQNQTTIHRTWIKA